MRLFYFAFGLVGFYGVLLPASPLGFSKGLGCFKLF